MLYIYIYIYICIGHTGLVGELKLVALAGVLIEKNMHV